MTYQENRQRIKNEALNKIRKLYNPKTNHNFTYYDGEGSTLEQIASGTEFIIEQMEKKLYMLRQIENSSKKHKTESEKN